MLKRRVTKIIFVLFCLITLVMPHISTVLAEVTRTKMSSPANLYVIMPREGGEVSGEITDSNELAKYNANYDKTQYVYKIAGNTEHPDGVTVFKIVSDDNGANYQNEIYCLNATYQFPGQSTIGTRDVEYREIANFANETDLNVRNLHLGTNYTTSSENWTENYRAVLWLINNIYLKHQAPDQRNEFIDKAFADWNEDDLDRSEIKYLLTDDDIDVAQQCAIWYFTNSDDSTYHSESLPIRIAEMSNNLNFESYRDKFGDKGTLRYNLVQHLYRYLINTAKTRPSSGSEVTYPELDSTNATVSSDASNTIIGPFRVQAGTADPSQYTLELLDQNGNVINRNDYLIKIEGEEAPTNKNINEIFNVNYSIYIPKTNRSIKKVQLHYKYTNYETECSLWQSTREVEQGEKPYQPVVLVTRGNTPHEVTLPYEIAPEADLALRKYIVKVNDTTITNRKPEPVLDGLKNVTATTADYKHAKQAVKVSTGDKVVYEIRVYNEGDVKSTGIEIVDALPKGLELAADSSINQTYGWTKVGEGNNLVLYKTTKLANTELRAFDPEHDTELPSAFVQIECQIKGDVADSTTLTNIAEICTEMFEKTDVNDRDSQTMNNPEIENDNNTDNYKGNSENKDDLTDKNYHYKGIQDDDDFEKVIVAKRFDLSLIKFISKVNDERITGRGNYTVVDLSAGNPNNLRVRIDKDTNIAPLKVSDKDLVTYTIRVFNEGQVAGYAAKVKDNIPTGLVFVPENSTNTTYKWKMYDANGQETDDATKAVYIETDYLSKENSDSRGERALQPYNGTTVDYRDLQVVFKVNVSSTGGNSIRNIAEISDDTDEDGNPVEDDDSEPDNDDPEEDDLDEEEVLVEAFDLNLKKFVTKVNKNALSTSRAPEVNVKPLKEGKTDAEYKFTTNKTPVKVRVGDIVEYTIRVYNEGEIDGYAEEISDYVPEGLGFLPEYTTNIDNYWSLTKNTYELKELKLKDIENATKNLSADDFTGVNSLDDVKVYSGKLKITSSKLNSNHEDKLLKAFDKTKTTLDSQDIKVVCIVLADTAENNNLRNIAEVTDQKDKDKNPVTDIDSTPNTVNPENYPDGEKRPDGTPQDDNDYEKLIPVTEPAVFDLSLKKFITEVNGNKITSREPKFVISSKDGSVKIEDPKVDPLQVEYGDKITYTIRVYNEGEINGYAAEVKDNVPKGLTFDSKNSDNQKYGWKMYDSNGKQTTDESKAVTIRTDYLCREKSLARNDGPIKAYQEGEKKFDFRDLQVVFTVNKDALKTDVSHKNDTIKNIAEISEDTDENGEPIDDIDSIPDNDKPKDQEDDIDDEEIFVKYFDLSLRKDLIKIEITEDGTRREILVNSTDGLQKVEIHRKKIDKTVVKFTYRITVTNEGQIAGYASEIKDYIPEGLEFISDENKQWTKASDNLITTAALSNTKLEPGKSASIDVVFKWKNSDKNMGLKTNIAEISKDKNDSNTPDIDSTPDNKVPKEDDYDTAEVFLAISTGTNQTYFILILVVLSILSSGLILIKKYVL